MRRGPHEEVVRPVGRSLPSEALTLLGFVVIGHRVGVDEDCPGNRGGEGGKDLSLGGLDRLIYE